MKILSVIVKNNIYKYIIIVVGAVETVENLRQSLLTRDSEEFFSKAAF